MDNVDEPSSAPSRTIFPDYVSSGNKEVDRNSFFHILERLKTQKRTGWVNNKILDAESIADHMYRMAVLALCSTDDTLDVSRCVMLCVVHDLAEAKVGDITPDEGYSKLEKQKLEGDAMKNISAEMLNQSVAANRICSLWEEYEQQETPEARFVKDLDRFEMACQADEYESRHNVDLQQFFDSSLPKIQGNEVRQWAAALTKERNARYAALNP